ncbi:MAG TPA: hypothetical protein VFM05_08245, partial [Candidatus Saccharimonadales bacterium]|nr:hypothetical protein [Candidatus Saccharimonadales bacterium]
KYPRTKEGHAAYRESDHWKNLHAAKLKQAGYECEFCPSRKRFDPHHLNYRNGDWESCTVEDLLLLCHRCHYWRMHPEEWGCVHTLLVRSLGMTSPPFFYNPA